jgi:hypothetical protein
MFYNGSMYGYKREDGVVGVKSLEITNQNKDDE